MDSAAPMRDSSTGESAFGRGDAGSTPAPARSAAYRPAYTEKELDAVIAALDKLLEREEPSVVKIAEVALLAASAVRDA